MKSADGYKVIEHTGDKLVIEKRFGVDGVIRITGNPDPAHEEHQRVINRIGEILRAAGDRETDSQTAAILST